jgi:hypothetical protein
MRPERAGIYRAEVTDVAAGRNPYGRWQIVFQFTLTQERDGETWRSAPEDWTIRTWQQLQKQDNTINERNVKDLRAAFGWPGDDPFWFENEMERHGLPPVQLVIAEEGEYQGRPDMKVKWINHHDYEGKASNGSLERASQDDRQAALAEIGAQLRALSGGGTTEAPARRLAPPPADAPATGMTEQDAWDNLCNRAALEGIPDDERDGMWADAVRDAKTPGQKVNADLTARQWVKVDALLAEALEQRAADAEAPAE